MSERFKYWMKEAWFSYLLWGTMMAVIFVGFGAEMKFAPTVNVLLAILGYGMAVGLRAVQYIHYDFSVPDND
jgi:hypothetical protein